MSGGFGPGCKNYTTNADWLRVVVLALCLVGIPACALITYFW